MVRTTPFSRIIGGEPSPNDLNRTLADVIATALHARVLLGDITHEVAFSASGFSPHRSCSSRPSPAVRRRPQRPSAITGPVTSVGPATATLTGTVNPNGQATTWYFEYGTSTSYGTRTANVSAGSGTANTAVSASVSGLTPATTYHYRVVATNSAGTARGADGIFTTPAPPVAVTSPATSVSPTSATLNGSVDPNGRATTWYFEYGTSTSYGSKTAERSAGAGSSTVKRLGIGHRASTRGRVYHYRLVATSDAGTSRGADRTFTTTVGAERGDRIGELDRADLGEAQRHRHARTARPRRGTSSTGRARATARRPRRRSAGSGTSTANVSASLTRLRTTTTYHYRLVATNGSGTTFGSDRSFSTSLAPAVRTGSVQNGGSTTATLTGSVDPRGRATTWYFEYGTSTSYGSRTARRSAGSGTAVRSVSEPLSGLVAGATYHFRLVATSDAGTSRGADGAFTTAGVTLATPARLVVYGRRITLTGTVPTRRGGEVVALLAQSYGAGGVHDDRERRHRRRRDAGATWRSRRSARPTWRAGTAARARRRPSASGRPSRCAGSRRARSRRACAAATRSRAASSSSSAARRRAGGSPSSGPVSNARSAAILRPSVPEGTSVLRIAMSVNQAGEGYLAGFSRRLVYRQLSRESGSVASGHARDPRRPALRPRAPARHRSRQEPPLLRARARRAGLRAAARRELFHAGRALGDERRRADVRAPPRVPGARPRDGRPLLRRRAGGGRAEQRPSRRARLPPRAITPATCSTRTATTSRPSTTARSSDLRSPSSSAGKRAERLAHAPPRRAAASERAEDSAAPQRPSVARAARTRGRAGLGC